MNTDKQLEFESKVEELKNALKKKGCGDDAIDLVLDFIASFEETLLG